MVWCAGTNSLVGNDRSLDRSHAQTDQSLDAVYYVDASKPEIRGDSINFKSLASSFQNNVESLLIR
jgi:hypothetical protein